MRGEYERTRRSLHAVAELVIAGPQYREHDDIRLRVLPGGFGTWVGANVSVQGSDLVHVAQRVPLDGRTCATLAAEAGLQVHLLDAVYSDGPGVAPDEPLHVHPRSVTRVLDALGCGDAALRLLDEDAERVLWPEHFDVAAVVAQVTFGVSPGDANFDGPYAYVSPPQPRAGTFWNAPFGATALLDDLGDTEAVTAFFREGAQAAGIAS